MKKKSSSGAIALVVIAIILVVLIAAGRGNASALLRGLLSIGRVILIVIVALIVVVLVFAFKSSSDEAEKNEIKKGEKAISAEKDEILKKGRANMVQLRTMIMRIRNTDVRNAANEICKVVEKILNTLKEKPKKISSVRQFFNYYLPTLGDVLKRFMTLEKSGISDEGAGSAEKVLSYLADVKSAMDRQYLNLFEEDKLNMEVDMEAMTMAIKRDGLLDESVQVNTEDEEETINLIL